jgi:hypothetical protein
MNLEKEDFWEKIINIFGITMFILWFITGMLGVYFLFRQSPNDEVKTPPPTYIDKRSRYDGLIP